MKAIFRVGNSKTNYEIFEDALNAIRQEFFDYFCCCDDYPFYKSINLECYYSKKHNNIKVIITHDASSKSYTRTIKKVIPAEIVTNGEDLDNFLHEHLNISEDTQKQFIERLKLHYTPEQIEGLLRGE